MNMKVCFLLDFLYGHVILKSMSTEVDLVYHEGICLLKEGINFVVFLFLEGMT